MKYYLIAGEASGDLHGSNLIRALHREDPQAAVRCWGGDRMRQAGATLVKHYRELAFMGFLEVIRHLPDIFRNLAFCKQDIAAFRPDALIFIDFSGFNLRVARWAKKAGIATHYYISPQVWASREGRVRQIRRDIDHMYVILPFEKAFYQQHDIPVHFVGHPLVDAMEGLPDPDPAGFRRRNGLDVAKPLIALLPGSRAQEIKHILPAMLTVVAHFPEFQFVVAGAPSLGASSYEPYLKPAGIPLVEDQTYALLQHAHAALVTSGTATLETALLGIPQVVCYKGSQISYQIARRLIRLRFISLVNLIMDREVVPELIQHRLNTKNLVASLGAVTKGEGREKQRLAYHELREKLGGAGASEKAARLIAGFSRQP